MYPRILLNFQVFIKKSESKLVYFFTQKHKSPHLPIQQN